MLPLLFLACAPKPEPLDLPQDPSATGVPVGVWTVQEEDLTLEVWYPAPDDLAGEPTDVVDVAVFLPASVTDLIGPVSLPPLDTGAHRDAPVRLPEEPYPVVFFSHGFGGFRTQSVSFTTHLASRGYVVVSMDHPGRMLGDIVPCLFSPPADGCNLSLEDPAEDQIPRALEWLDQAAREGGALFERVDTERLGLSGHSAGANSTATVGDREERFDALFPMAGSGSVAREVPTTFLAGTCDATLPVEDTEAAFQVTASGTLVEIGGAGHLAFTDLCDLDLMGLSEQYLRGRDDINDWMLEGLEGLAADGCAGSTPPEGREDCAAGYLDLSVSAPIVNHYGTVFFDQVLRGTGEGVQDGVFPEATVQ